ncbi:MULTISPECIES: ATP synthase F1 subunit epsilon [Saprospira]|uniref:H+-transporting two-sector ATPase, epsilon subunit n=2 Tax=Saprospira grandis TaxID=1008 RepID=H6L281_SAPGL|nr:MULTISPECIES: ATP synthase F1 subunit epsilon [Saprospira]AFC24719.1 H+-transporting two-sector ATPase, epsilon subunit [Saprospira grandis str. Lewin]EJF53276.1 ATP synthase, F1 epsilon subunit [Saprospira grandis DSM 2844]WBM76124.1 ATP synthase F1 subunit epsilon [Saprospira grandis]WCL82922.1 ATP synthase F1 subunit epsilon [Saprospira sp. CCB-QB6]
MELIVLTPDKKVFEGKISSITVPGVDGEFEVLENHAAIVASLQAGDVSFLAQEGGKQELAIQSGFIEVLDNKVSLLVQE